MSERDIARLSNKIIRDQQKLLDAMPQPPDIFYQNEDTILTTPGMEAFILQQEETQKEQEIKDKKQQSKEHRRFVILVITSFIAVLSLVIAIRTSLYVSGHFEKEPTNQTSSEREPSPESNQDRSSMTAVNFTRSKLSMRTVNLAIRKEQCMLDSAKEN